MSSKTTKVDKTIVGICIGVLVFFAFSIILRFFTLGILIKKLNINNAFTRLVWFDNAEAGRYEEIEVGIDWEMLYPFDNTVTNSNTDMVEDDAEIDSTINVQLSPGYMIDTVKSVVELVEDNIESYTMDLLVFYTKITEEANRYEEYIGWNFSPYGEYNGVFKLSDGHLTECIEEKDTTEHCLALTELDGYLRSKDIDLLYVQAPCKISEYDDESVSGVLDFSNQNVDELLTGLKEANIDYYDIRESIHDNNLSNHDLFYKTDHHWTTATGLWASQNILAFCNEQYGWNANLALLESDQFEFVKYEKCFLGSYGKKVTLSRCVPDDFELIYPMYDTKFHYSIPSQNVDVVGDYSVVYDMSKIEKIDYYGINTYGTCNYGDQPLIQIQNLNDVDKHKILIIKDSFADCVISCLALVEQEIDCLDIRKFTGSVKTYIEESEPDLVIVMYNAQQPGGDIDYSTHNDIFDFR
jgi:hypothetical protein